MLEIRDGTCVLHVENCGWAMNGRGAEARERELSLVEARAWIDKNAANHEQRAKVLRRLEELLPESKSVPLPPTALRSSPVTVILRSPNHGEVELVANADGVCVVCRLSFNQTRLLAAQASGIVLDWPIREDDPD
jgi:hypothetical protein